MSDTIKQAREILATARKKSRAAGPQNGFWLTGDIDPAVKRLVMLTAGNREALDAIDEMLRIADTRMSRREEPAFVLHAERIAAALIKADSTLRLYVKEGAASPVPEDTP